MESDKQGGSETSSEENDQPEQVKDDMAAKRSYGCTFCKRGFTNAQALGGHMNIHRKDRAKAKQLRNPSLPNNSNEDNILYTDFSPVSFEPTTCFPVFEAQTKSRMYSQPSASEPGHPHANLSQNDLSGSRARSWNTNQEFLGANLSLNIGATHGDDDGRKGGFNKAEEVDLELRLGHDPYWK